jgi:hypothetical protein
VSVKFSPINLLPPAVTVLPDSIRRSNLKHPIVKLGLPLLVMLAAGCTTMGTGFGSTASGANPASFKWKSSDSVSGTMSVTLADGKDYSGQFFQITKDTTVDSVGPLWAGWNSGWTGRAGWGYWNEAPTPGFLTNYTGQVVANLGSPGGEHVRCRFHLVHPADGMSGGGAGQCQTPDGQTIDATFPSA